MIYRLITSKGKPLSITVAYMIAFQVRATIEICVSSKMHFQNMVNQYCQAICVKQYVLNHVNLYQCTYTYSAVSETILSIEEASNSYILNHRLVFLE